ncbi:MAG TPA: hypothetical protein VL995_01265 [Cellvibrio sp.]|nr:hypothetical protein [Cellvibrio sp.]
MIEWLISTVEEFFDGANQALTAAFKLAIIGFMLFLAWKYIQVLIKYTIKTIRISLAVISFPLAFSLIPIVHQYFFKEYVHFNVTFIIGVFIASCIPFLIAGSFDKKSNIKAEE